MQMYNLTQCLCQALNSLSVFPNVLSHSVQGCSGSLPHELKWHVSVYLYMIVFTHHCIPHENLLSHYCFFFFSQLGLLLLEKCIKTNWLELPLQTPTFLISDFYPSISWILKLRICNSRPKDPFHFHPPLKQL